MKLGMGVINGVWLREVDQGPHAEVFARDLAEARLAEEVGLDSVWCTEHHFLNTGNNPNPLLMCAAIAATTSRIEFGPAILQAPLYHPVRLAEDCAVVDLLSRGRLRVGLGLGYREEEYAGLGVPYTGRGRRANELLEILRKAWSPDPVAFDGAIFRFTNVDVNPKPYREGGPPIWVGGHSDAAFKRAAQYGDGFIMDAGTDVDAFATAGYNRVLIERVEEAVARYRLALERVGKRFGDQEFAINIGGFLSADGADDAWEKVQRGYLQTRRTYAAWYGLPGSEYQAWVPEKMNAAQHAARKRELCLGRPRDLVPLFRALLAIVGERLHIMFRTKYPGVAHADICDSIALLGELRRELSGGD